ncbi:hypothetical protein GF359_09315 [candidate division WOR-3 bacterium]|uniref:DUF4412 domain-containing protein n=1 Tax=candidate division WOR-3 bacterium TaxID=2052148 RepID=A0A9D5QD60_UNCW3|nr:hypothetical protein [candidate division WOR-3 bacterium]MBD3365398.1 hypothetical protein [candidate division WOR-3 bacterium]
MKREIIVCLTLVALLFAGCGTVGFDEQGIEKAIEKQGPFDVLVDMDSENNVKVTLKEYTEDTGEWSSEEERDMYFFGVCIGAVGALAMQTEKDLGILDVEIDREVISLSLDFVSAIAQAVGSGDLTDEEMGELVFEVYGFQLMLEESVEDETPFDVSVILTWDDPAFNIKVNLEKILSDRHEWSNYGHDERVGYFTGVCAGATGVLATLTNLEFNNIIMTFNNETWLLPVDFCIDIVEVSSTGELTEEQIGEALFANLEQIK